MRLQPLPQALGQPRRADDSEDEHACKAAQGIQRVRVPQRRTAEHGPERLPTGLQALGAEQNEAERHEQEQQRMLHGSGRTGQPFSEPEPFCQ